MTFKTYKHKITIIKMIIWET